VIAYSDHKYPQCILSECFIETRNGIFLSNISFIRKLIEFSNNYKPYVHGPCLLFYLVATDQVYDDTSNALLVVARKTSESRKPHPVTHLCQTNKDHVRMAYNYY
jgi:hypothetical protein